MLTTLNKEASPNILVRVRDPPFSGVYRNKKLCLSIYYIISGAHGYYFGAMGVEWSQHEEENEMKQ